MSAAVINAELQAALAGLLAAADEVFAAKTAQAEQVAIADLAMPRQKARTALDNFRRAALAMKTDPDPLRVACITLDGTTLTVPIEQIGDVLHGEDGQHTYTLRLKEMSRAAFKALGEFDGF